MGKAEPEQKVYFNDRRMKNIWKNVKLHPKKVYIVLDPFWEVAQFHNFAISDSFLPAGASGTHAPGTNNLTFVSKWDSCSQTSSNTLRIDVAVSIRLPPS